MAKMQFLSVLSILLAASCQVLSQQKISSFEKIPSLNIGNFRKLVKGKDSFVMFYAPWCGHCKKLKPTWLELFQKHDSDSLSVATVDCTVETKLCSEENIRGYPTLLLYIPNRGYDLQNGVRFVGDRTLAALEEFIVKHSSDAENVEVVVEKSVYVLTKENYQQVFQQGDVFVMFYAPWCGHCKSLMPTWESLANEHNANSEEGTAIAKVDCTQYSSICTEYDVKGYPTLLYLRAGRLIAKYDGARTEEELQMFIEKHEEEYSDTDQDDDEDGRVTQYYSDEEEDDEAVVTITGATFQKTIASAQTISFIEFYAPWCGHCKRLAPIWESLAKHFSKDSGVTIGKLDCTEHNHICKVQKVDGYPTLKLYKGGKMIMEYTGDRSYGDLIKFVTQHKTRDEL